MMYKMSDRPKLTIAYSTLPERVQSIVFPIRREDREILVLVQNPKENSYVLEERSAKLIELRNLGVAKSRNAALERANGEYLLFGDDDILFNESGITEALLYLDQHPECAIVLAQARDNTGALRKEYFSCAARRVKRDSFPSSYRYSPGREFSVKVGNHFRLAGARHDF